MLRLRKTDQEAEPFLILNKKGKKYLFILNEVKYLSSRGKQTIIHTIDKESIVPFMFKEIEKNIPQTFVRINKQIIVNMGFIVQLTHISGGRYKVTLKDKKKTELIVSRTYISDLRKKIN